MGLSVDSKIKDIKKNPEAVKIMERYSEGFSTNPQMKMVQGLTFRKLASFPQSKAAGITDEVIAKIDEELFSKYGFKVEQLMELAGLACAKAFHNYYPQKGELSLSL